MPPERRAAHYRELANRHLEYASHAKAPEARAAHLELAALWTRLAGEADRQAHTPELRPDAAPSGEAPETSEPKT